MDPRKLLEGRSNPLPEGTLSVGAGLIVSGITSYGFLAISARALGPEKYAPLGVLWALTYVVCPGVFLPRPETELVAGRAVEEGVPEEVVEQFKEFIDRVNPDDFAS